MSLAVESSVSDDLLALASLFDPLELVPLVPVALLPCELLCGLAEEDLSELLVLWSELLGCDWLAPVVG